MEGDVIHLRDQVAVLRRRWRVLLISTLVGGLLALGYSTIQDPEYAASAQVLISPTGIDQSGNAPEIDSEEIATQVLVITSASVAQGVIDELHLDTEPHTLLKSIAVEQEDATRVVNIQARTASREDAAVVANAFAEVYLAHRAESASEAANADKQALQSRYDDVSAEIASVQKQLGEAQPGSPDARGLQAQEQALTVQLINLLGDMSKADVADAGSSAGGQILVEATPPLGPAQTGLVRMGLLGALLGLFLGIGLAFARDHFDDVLRDEAGLRTAIRDRPVLGRIPRSSEDQRARLVTMLAPQSPSSEAYRSLSSGIRFLLAGTKGEHSMENRGKVLLVTSSAPNEGKTVVASNLAVAAARFGLRVILVDADLRRPTASPRFGLGAPPGLSDYLASEGAELDDYLIDVGVPGLRVLAGGSIPPNPAELLGADSTTRTLDALRSDADLVIVDSAPVTMVADTRELVPLVDVVLLVTRLGLTHMRAITDAVERIRQVGGRVTGAVLNDVEARKAAAIYGYGEGPGAAVDTKHIPKRKLVPARMRKQKPSQPSLS